MKQMIFIFLLLATAGHVKADVLNVTNTLSSISCDLDDGDGDQSYYKVTRIPGTNIIQLEAQWYSGLISNRRQQFAIDNISFNTVDQTYTVTLSQNAGLATVRLNDRNSWTNRPRGYLGLSGILARNAYNCQVQ